MQPVLPVGDLPQGIPMDGMEYLALCRLEASKIPDLMVHSTTYSKPIIYQPDAILNEIPKESRPTQGWIKERLGEFRKLSKVRARPNLQKSELSQSFTAWKQYFKQNKPRLLPLNQQTLLRILNSFVEQDIETNELVWIYGLLARLDKLLEADDQAMLRELMKKVRLLRGSRDDENFIGCTLLIVIIGHEFGQRDLLD